MNWNHQITQRLFSGVFAKMTETQKLLFRKRVEKQICGESMVRLNEVHEAMRKDLLRASQ